MKVALCCICKNEENYIIEWINYYFSLKFDTIIIIDNNDIGNNLMKNIIDKENNSNLIYIDKFKGKQYCQKEAYQYIYINYKNNFDWISFFDIDEFLEFKDKNENIKLFLKQDKFKNVDQIRFCWQLYDDNDLLDVINNNYSIKRFTRKLPSDHHRSNQCKSIINTKYNNINNLYPHGIYDKNAISVNSIGEECMGISCNIGEVQFLGDAWLNHYRTKTIGEYVKFKMFRGDARSEKFKNKYTSLNGFWKDNIKTKEKEDYANKLIKELSN